MHRIGDIAEITCATSTMLAVGSYLVLGTAGIHDTMGWPLFGIHLLATLIGALSSAAALVARRWWCLLPAAVCVYILLFQSTSAVPAPFMLFE